MNSAKDRERNLDEVVLLKAAGLVEKLANAASPAAIRAEVPGAAQPEDLVQRLVQDTLDRSVATATADLMAFKEVYGSAGLLTADRLRERGRKASALICGNNLLAFIRNYPAILGPVSMTTVQELVSREVWIRQTRFLDNVANEVDHLSKMENECAGDAKHHVFVSFGAGDRELANSAAEQLRAKGIKAFLAARDNGRQDAGAELRRNALMGSRELLMILSRDTIADDSVLIEWGAAWAANKGITLLAVDLQTNDLPAALRSTSCIHSSSLAEYAHRTGERIVKESWSERVRRDTEAASRSLGLFAQGA